MVLTIEGMKCPELEKMDAVKGKSQIIGEFLDWLRHAKQVELCKYRDMSEDDSRLFPINTSIEMLLAEYFNIDLRKAEEERRSILEKLQGE
jgi:hypothetical protein